jgi:hypothetical protein
MQAALSRTLASCSRARSAAARTCARHGAPPRDRRAVDAREHTTRSFWRAPASMAAPHAAPLDDARAFPNTLSDAEADALPPAQLRATLMRVVAYIEVRGS